MDNYCDFAYLYDKLTADVEYIKRADYLEDLFKNSMEYKPVLIADVGCGTGTICNILSDRGYDMIGIDSSYDMLNVAREKSQDKSILYLNQDMTEFELYGTVDVITCMLDSLNYLIEDGEIEEFFKLCHNYLNPGGLLIFDINTVYKFENILSDNIYNYEDDDVFYSWENSFDGQICEFYLNFFVKKSDGTYNRITEQHFERAYTVEHIKSALKQCGFDDVNVYSDMTMTTAKEQDERVFFVVKKH